MDGFLLINKPANMTSHDVVDAVKKQFKFKKIGHTGTLDPFATGLLILCIGKATKLSDYVTAFDKTYEGTLVFGMRTDTFDSTGQILEETSPNLKTERIDQALCQMVKSYDQRPPIYSAIKTKGQKSYALARKGVDFELDKRPVTIFEFRRLSEYQSLSMDFHTKVSKGTYIRSLVVDLAESLETIATLKALKRTSIGPYGLDEATELTSMSLEDIYPLERYLEGYQKLTLSPYLIHLVKNGIVLDERQIKTDAPFLVYDETGKLIAFYDVYREYTYKPVLIF